MVLKEQDKEEVAMHSLMGDVNPGVCISGIYLLISAGSVSVNQEKQIRNSNNLSR